MWKEPSLSLSSLTNFLAFLSRIHSPLILPEVSLISEAQMPHDDLLHTPSLPNFVSPPLSCVSICFITPDGSLPL